MRRLAIWLAWLVAIATVVAAIGLQVRAARMADARQVLRAWLHDVPREVEDQGRVVGRDAGHLHIELHVHPRWVRIFAERNGFTPIDAPLQGMVAERWVLTTTRKPGAIAHLLLPQRGPALVTIIWP